jgi:hypothetical protein
MLALSEASRRVGWKKDSSLKIKEKGGIHLGREEIKDLW